MDNTEKLRVLFERFLRDQCSAEEVKQLFSYIRENPVSDELDPLLEKVWRKLGASPPIDKSHREQLLKRIKMKTVRERPGRKWPLPLKIAAAITLIAVVVGVMNILKDKRPAVTNLITKSTQVGQRASYKLPDGSTVSLNSGSAITFPEKLNDSVRIVYLEGEAFFEVVKNTAQPFVVESARIKTKVLGTSFNVRAYEGQDIEVTVATGKVQVESVGKTPSEDNQVVLLTPNEQAIYSLADNSFTQSTVNVRKFLAWNSKELILENISMKDVILMLEKRFDQRIILENSEISNCTIRKVRYGNESLETILKGLQSLLDFEYQFNGDDQWTIIGKGCK